MWCIESRRGRGNRDQAIGNRNWAPGAELERFGHFVEDERSGAGRIGCLVDGAADDEVAGAEAEGFGGSADAFLISEIGAGGAHSGDNENRLRAGKGADAFDFMRGANKPFDACVEAHAGKKDGLIAGRDREADGLGLGQVDAGEHGDGEELRRVWDFSERGAGSGEHGGAARGVNVEHADAEAGGGTNRAGNGVGDVVEFEIEKDGVAALENGFEHRGSGGSEKFEADFEPEASAVEPVDKVGGRGGIGNVEGDDELLAREGTPIGLGPRDCRRGSVREGWVQALRNGHSFMLKQSTFRRHEREPAIKRDSFQVNQASAAIFGSLAELSFS